MKNMKVSTKLYILVSALFLVIGIIGINGENDLKAVNGSLETVFKDRVLCLKQLKVISDMYLINIRGTTQKIKDGGVDFKTSKKKIIRAQKEIKSNWVAYLATDATPEEKKLSAQTEELMHNSDESLES